VNTKWRIAFIVALANDALDLVGIGSTPVIGNAFDLASTGIIYVLTGEKRTFPALIELLPFIDLLPTFTVSVLWAYRNKKVN